MTTKAKAKSRILEAVHETAGVGWASFICPRGLGGHSLRPLPTLQMMPHSTAVFRVI